MQIAVHRAVILPLRTLRSVSFHDYIHVTHEDFLLFKKIFFCLIIFNKIDRIEAKLNKVHLKGYSMFLQNYIQLGNTEKQHLDYHVGR